MGRTRKIVFFIALFVATVLNIVLVIVTFTGGQNVFLSYGWIISLVLICACGTAIPAVFENWRNRYSCIIAVPGIVVILYIVFVFTPKMWELGADSPTAELMAEIFLILFLFFMTGILGVVSYRTGAEW